MDLKQYLLDLVQQYPTSYIKMLKSVGVHKGVQDRSEMLQQIEDAVPKLADPMYSLKLKINWILKDRTDFPRCQHCGKLLDYICNVKNALSDYPRFCSRKCQANAGQTKDKMHSTLQERYGTTNAFCIDKVKAKLHDNKDAIQAKRQQTKLEHFGDEFYNNAHKAALTKKEKYGSVWNTSKCMQTWLSRYGVDSPFKMQPESATEEQKLLQAQMKSRRLKTLKDNGTFNTSKAEEQLYAYLASLFSKVKRQFKSAEYPFSCDFYIEDIDMYVEYNGSWTHGPHAFDAKSKTDRDMLAQWQSKAESSKFYQNAIQTWTVRDTKKRDIAREHKLNYKEFWSLDQAYQYFSVLAQKLSVSYAPAQLQEEFEYYKKAKVVQDKPSRQVRGSKIVEQYQQDIFYKHENQLWQDKRIAFKLLKNREQYLGKEASELTSIDLLHGFKHSGMWYRYSHFNPLWLNWFINKFGIKTLYDPCGGWGHRLLGALSLDKYIYNDFSAETRANVDKMIADFGIKNTTTFQNDATTFIPADDYEAVFTCPPYFNVEVYPCGEFKNIEQYNQLLKGIWRAFECKSSCRVMGIVLREDMLIECFKNWSQRHLLSKTSIKYLSGSKNKQLEYMYIYQK